MSSYRNTRGRRRGAGADGPPESDDAVAGQRQPQSPRQQDSAEDLTGTGTANPAPRCERVDLLVEIQGLDDGARGPTGTIEVYRPDKSAMASRCEAYAFAIRGLEALSPNPPGGGARPGQGPPARRDAGLQGEPGVLRAARGGRFGRKGEVLLSGGRARADHGLLAR